MPYWSQGAFGKRKAHGAPGTGACDVETGFAGAKEVICQVHTQY
jgi:hypothetical protein